MSNFDTEFDKFESKKRKADKKKKSSRNNSKNRFRSIVRSNLTSDDIEELDELDLFEDEY